MAISEVANFKYLHEKMFRSRSVWSFTKGSQSLLFMEFIKDKEEQM